MRTGDSSFPSANYTVTGLARDLARRLPPLHLGPMVPEPVPPDPPPFMRLRRSRSLTQALLEIGIVVVGILIAFALDAGWARRRAAAEERAHIRALSSDFESNAQRLERLIRLEERISSGSATLLGIAVSGDKVSADSIAGLMSIVFTSNRYEPVMGAYEALVNSAGLTIIRDDSLRAALAEYAARVNGRYYERYSDELYFAFIRDFTGRLQIFDGVQESPRSAESYAALLRDPRFREQLALRHLSERDVARRYRELHVQAAAIRAMLAAQLGS